MVSCSPNLKKMKDRKEDCEDFGVSCVTLEKEDVLEPKKDDPYLEREPPETNAPLRSPICCVVGPPTTGKTALLDCIRGTDADYYVHTQRITATHVPSDFIIERSHGLMNPKPKIRVPGLLFLDTPGFYYFEDITSEALALCDIAVFVVNIMFGLHLLNLYSLNLIRNSNKKFIIVINQVDRLSGWKPCENATFDESLNQQSLQVQDAFHANLTRIIRQFKKHGRINTELYDFNKDMGETVSIVPTCAKSGEGISDMLYLLVKSTQNPMVKKLTYREELQCYVLEAKFVEGYGVTINVILVNGTLHEGDQIVVRGSQENIVTSIQYLFSPSPLKEIGAKGTYLRYSKIEGGRAIKIIAQGLENAIGGHDLYVLKPDSSKNVEEIAV